MGTDQSETLSKWTTVLFLVAAVLPLLGFFVASTLNPTGWLSDTIVFPYVYLLVLLEAIPGLELNYLTLILSIVVVGIIVYALRQKYKVSSPRLKFGFAISTFVLSILYTLYTGSIVASAEDHEFIG